MSMKTESPVKLCLFFTHNVSLAKWERLGLFDREITPYKKLIQKEDIEIAFITYGDRTDLSFSNRLAPIKVLPLFKNKIPKLKFLIFLQALLGLWCLRHEVRGYHIYKSNQMLGSHLALCARLLFGGKFMLRTGYELLDFTVKDKAHLLKRTFAFLLSWLSYLNADMIVVASKNDENFAKRAFPSLRHRHFEIQPNWIDVDKFKPVLDTINTKRDFVFVGRLEHQKNLATLIDAAALASVELDIIGQGSKEKELKAQIKANGAKIRILPPVRNSSLPKYFKHYRCFILPSLFEGNPKTLLEAMSCAMPIIGADVPGISSVLDHRKDGMLCIGKADNLAHAMLELLSNEREANKWGKAARQKIKRHNSLQSFLNEEMRRYRQLHQAGYSD